MKSRQDESREYSAFVGGPGVSPPPALDHSVRESIAARLHPSFGGVFGKLAATHLVASAVTLSVCPQFQFRLAGEGHGLMGVFMDHLGPVGCTLACGSFFMGTSAALATFVLNRDEARSLRGRTLPAVLSLLLPSLAFFLLIGVMRGTLTPSDFAQADTALWGAGALLGGWSALTAGLKLRFQTV